MNLNIYFSKFKLWKFRDLHPHHMKSGSANDVLISQSPTLNLGRRHQRDIDLFITWPTFNIDHCANVKPEVQSTPNNNITGMELLLVLILHNCPDMHYNASTKV